MPNPTEYLNGVLDIIERHSLKRAVIDWPTLRQAAVEALPQAPTIGDAHEAVRMVLREVADGHSFFVTAAEFAAWDKHRAQTEAIAASGRVLDGRIGYVRIPGFSAFEVAEMTRFAAETQALIRSLDQAVSTGWIVDLRENAGGNMWPMIAGLGPLIGEGVLGAFVAPDGKQGTWFYRNGSAGCEGQAICAPSPRSLPAGPILCHVDTPYQLKRREARVAVLIGPGTASSGEAVALAFRGRPGARSFGARTRGQTTGNTIFEMRDGALLFLASVVEADRTGQQFSSNIEPDEWVGEDEGSSATIAAASRWLLGRPQS